jgi:hypothetical protein
MGNYNDSHVVQIGDDVTIPERAYHLIGKLAEVKNKTKEALIEEYILTGLGRDLEDHSRLGERYSDYLKERYQYDPQGRWRQ